MTLKPRLALVDDEKDNLDALHRLLRSHYEVETFISPLEALKRIQKREFAVIVSDQRMPELSGVELLEKTRSMCPDTTRVLLTGYTDLDSVIGAINRGHIYRYIAKPWDPEDLKMTVRQAAEFYRLKKELLVAHQNLSTLNLAKSRFLSLISHELNTPLTILNSFLHLLEERPLEKDDRKMILKLRESSDRLNQVVGQVVEFVAIESLPIKSEALRLPEVVRSIDKKVSVKGELSIFGDKKLLTLAFQKLFEELPKDLEILFQENSMQLSWKGDESPHILEVLDFKTHPMNHQSNLGLKVPLFRSILERHGAEMKYHHQNSQNTIEVRF